MAHDARLATALAGRYSLRREIGAGGMATVYLADDLRHARPVAIKVLKPDLARAIGHERFLREIEIAAGLRHPNILPLFDSGAADGLLYYIMPFVEGASLRERLDREKKLPVEEALRITAEVADALAYAHERDVVHRDIKPENILLERGRAFVADFGVARAVTAAETTRMTQSGAMVGTVAYMSPEQSSGIAEVDGRSDLYSLACVLYEMLAGEAPFAGPTMEAILVRRFTEPPPRLSATRPGTPTAIDAALQRAMARVPAERFATASQFAEALTPHGAVLEETRENSIAVLPFANTSGVAADEYFSDGVAEEIINALSQIPGLKVAARTSAFSFKGRQEDLRSIGAKLNVQTVLEGSVRKSGTRLRITAQLVDVRNGYQLWSERYDRELTDVFVIQDEIATSIAARFKIAAAPEPDSAGRRGTENLEAYEWFLKGRAFHHKRGQFLRNAIECFERAIELDPEYTVAMGWLSDAYQLMGVYGYLPPVESMLKARAMAERALALDPEQDEAYSTLADVASTYDRDSEAAFRNWERALELNPSQTRARSRWAMWGLALMRHDYDRAIAEGARSCHEDPRNSFAFATQCYIFGYAGRFDEALEMARRAIELEPESFFARNMYLQACSWAGNHEEAIEEGRRLLPASGRHPWALGALAAAYGRAGKPGLARAIHREMEARAEGEYVQKSMIAMAAISAGSVDRAVELIREGLEERDAVLKQLPNHPAFEALRAHPEYEDLCRRIGSP